MIDKTSAFAGLSIGRLKSALKEKRTLDEMSPGERHLVRETFGGMLGATGGISGGGGIGGMIADSRRLKGGKRVLPILVGAALAGPLGALAGAKQMTWLGKKVDEARAKKKTAQAKQVMVFKGLPIVIDRPRGFVQHGVDDKGQPWTRKYRHNYGYIKGTRGGDGDGLDVFLGPDRGSNLAFWAIQTKKDGKFDEYKVFLGFENRESAISAYKRHIPQKLLKGMVTMKINMMKAMLGIEPMEKLGMMASFMDELEKMEVAT